MQVGMENAGLTSTTRKESPRAGIMNRKILEKSGEMSAKIKL